LDGDAIEIDRDGVCMDFCHESSWGYAGSAVRCSIRYGRAEIVRGIADASNSNEISASLLSLPLSDHFVQSAIGK
jgi:hypothetical protein